MSLAEYSPFSASRDERLGKSRRKIRAGGNLEALNWITPEGISVKPLYTAADIKGLEYADTLPGMEPYLRGPQATMYAVRPWTIRQYAGFSTAEASNAFYRKALAAGGQGSRWHSTWRPTAATIRTIRACWAMSARPALQSIRSRT